MTTAPATRTSRLRLRRSLDTAVRAIGVLEQKIQVLTREQRRLRHHALDTGQQWEAAARDADLWLQRSLVLGGNTQVALAATLARGERAEAAVTWRSVMGVAYPTEAHVIPAKAPPLGSLARTAALVEAAAAHRQAVVAALDQAAAQRALDLLERELLVTRRRLRALEHRWVPRLNERLTAVELALAAEEQEDAVRTRWVAGRDGGRR
jgi:V/A-type H+-transporting ATPase subunit D